MLLSKQKKAKGNRVLITVNVLGSAGPLRFVVNEGEVVAAVIDMALKSYAREGRLPVLGSNLNDFLLHCPSAGSDALSPLETIGAHGARNFLLCKKPQPEKAANVEVGAESAAAATATATATATITRRGNGSWKSWINKTIILKIASH